MTVAVFPGSFDPITNGHLDIIKRASDIFDKVIVVIGINSTKKPLFSVEERIDLIKQNINAFQNVSVSCTNDLIVNYASSVNAKVIVRGIRDSKDMDYEKPMASVNKDLNSDIENVYLLSDSSKNYISSSMVKELCRFKGNVSRYVPLNVKRSLEFKFKGEDND
ncbi:pantetheine-phosphate adenylyltransferase [Apilactobacillus ozensis]|uniref:Phosphopantetheine adenylyltransferase n=1 Tax=Apilactobacillus ozensis DSM 23829 = JCM 17196 TaxID=1423781 RepID=A0A0R2APV6_9LACO|nr:pantetheine-phosphate adenylyltransferase [Apilactobacillus ozensis]KRM68666.1 phosphopantetheine adenylyltransferase [Apilactobacillus ozensis DSM 23829 = JCM 17196]MCK8607320.1 pantetheine-phosphate adenylyltransferase [Apilactobacillus ozensis]